MGLVVWHWQDPHVQHTRRQEDAVTGGGVTGSESASLGEEVLIIVASGSTSYRKYREIIIQGQISKALVGSEGIRTSGAHQSLVGRAIRTWPKIEMDELVFRLPEKKWMSIYAHRAYLVA